MERDQSVSGEDVSIVGAGNLYETPNDALRTVREEYLYWTARLAATSTQLSYGLIAANWAVFGSIDAILSNPWSKVSLSLVIVGLALNVVTSMAMGKMHRLLLEDAEDRPEEWKQEFYATAGKKDPFPFTRTIERLGSTGRWARMLLPIGGGVAFLIALFV